MTVVGTSVASNGKSRLALPAELPAQAVTGICDTREQHQLDLAPLQVITGTLTTGDYSVVGLEHVIAVERKSLSDLCSVVGVERERFEREVERLLAFPVRALVVEADWRQIEMGQWRSKVTPAAVTGSLLGWMAMGLPVLLAGNHERAGRFVSRLLFVAARRRWREAKQFADAIIEHKNKEQSDAIV